MVKPVIYITRKLPDNLIKPFQETYDIRMWDEASTPVPTETLREEVKHADALFCLITEKIDREFLREHSHLKVIANMAVGYDNIDVEAAKEYGVTITNTPDVLTETTADLTFTLLLSTARRIVEAANTIYQNNWGDWAPFSLAGSDVHGKTLGIVGMGRIGAAVARRAKGFNMNVIYHNRSRKKEVEEELDLSYVTQEELLETADFVVSLVPLTDETKEMFNRTAFAKMKTSAIFINASRGGVVDETALYNALKDGEITAAGLDVFQEEPISSVHPFASLSNAVLLPHIGSATVQTREAMAKLCLENIEAVTTGKKAKTPIT
ncbi:MAG TPA: D-glycerate dehydrogenase [Pseudogracilibacillus sp.]|nr:D-glycerate dehydrogenase [Pseudogracilibacillus sp.]